MRMVLLGGLHIDLQDGNTEDKMCQTVHVKRENEEVEESEE